VGDVAGARTAHSVMPLTAAIVEDDPFARTMLVATLRSQGVEVVVETDTPALALEFARLHRPRVALLDLHLGEGPTGIDLAHALRSSDPRIGIVILTSFDDPRLLSTRLPDPPVGSRYLTKREVASILVCATVTDAARGVAAAITKSDVMEGGVAR